MRGSRRAPRESGRSRDVADLELERFKATERPAHQSRDHVDAVAFVDGLGDVGPTERDPVEDVAVALERQLAMAAGGSADTCHGEAEDGDQRVRVPGPARGEGSELPVEYVVDGHRRQGKVDGEREARVARHAIRCEGEEALAE